MTSRSRSLLCGLLASGAAAVGCSAEVAVATSGASGIGGASAASSSGATVGDGGAASTADGAGGSGATTGAGGSGPCAEGPCWATRYGGQHKTGSRSVGLSGAGNLVITGSTSVPLDFGGGPIAILGSADLFVAALDPTGKHLWSRTFGAPGGLTGGDQIAVANDGSMVLTGISSGTVDLGGGPRCLPFSQDQALVVKLDAGGNPVYSVCFGAPNGNFYQPVHLALSASGDAFVAGTFQGTIDFGGGPLYAANGPLFVARLDPAGKLVWVKTFGDENTAVEIRAVAAAQGEIVVACSAYTPIDFGGGPLVPKGVNAANVVVARLDSAGSHVWSKVFASTASAQEDVTSIAVDGAGRLVMTGELSGTVDYGGGPLVSAGKSDVFLASFDGAGLPLWSERFGGSSDDVGLAIRSDASGNLVLLASVGSPVSLGGPALPGDPWGLVIARFDAAGGFLDDRFIDAAYGEGLAVEGQRFAVVGTAQETTLDLGGLAISGAKEGVFVGMFAF